MSYQIYLVEDEINLNQVLVSYLEKEGWQVFSFLDGKTAFNQVKDRPHLWILDIMLPGIDGFQLIKEIKEDCPNTPVIFISARDADIDRIVGLEMGSDDYLAKPFLPRELVLRAKKLLERTYGAVDLGNLAVKPLILVGCYTIDENARQVTGENHSTIELTSKEFDLLLFFIEHQGQSLKREQILQQIWGDDYFGSDRVVDDLIRRLRKKMPDLRLETVYGYGYRLVKL